WPTLADVQRLARRIYLGGRLTSPVNAPSPVKTPSLVKTH
ncbi:MAG: hypothetical protein JWQ55_1425, partial [Rhodopila sp.]|nr:hypothetical protein [Rhodopila sp.]